MSLLHVIQQQGHWLLFDGATVTRSDSRPRLAGAAVVVSDFENAVSNVISLEGSPAHAVALIERRLRSDGMIDGESKILIHRTRSIGAGYQTLFTAVPLDLWQQTYAWAEAQPDHCLLIPFTSLLFKSLRPGLGLVLQSGRQVSVLAVLKHDMIYRTALAYSEDPSDMAMTVGALAEQFAEDLGSGEDSLEPLALHWCPVLVPRPDAGQPWSDDALREVFAVRSGLRVDSVPLRVVRDEQGNEYRSGIGWIQSQARPGIAINPLASRLAWSAESLLPVASAASLVFALILAALGARWALTGSEASARADEVGSEIEAIEQRIAAMQAQQAMPEGFAGVQAFIERATRLHDGADPSASLAQVRDAAAGQVRILRVKLEEPAAAPRNPGMPAAPTPPAGDYTLRVDGVADPWRGTPGMQVPAFVEGLRRAGFDPQPVDPQGGGMNTRSAGGFFSYLLKRPPAAAAEVRP
ncbi:hypothetical protein GXB84_17340 [Stenotrophomonas acidaminiphila]|uniref:hypothetical protein n=1 Tax=Stenotrophomonas acidaminiphila TaxID=128780 RepID=UPI001375705D|nr:hypothetical protein [Stenotrophomonas acidaminiphila]NCT89084.1 hypothetical protein [Stenotrophomonas acidaminiphila]